VVYLDATNTASSIVSVPKETAAPAQEQAPRAISSALPYLQNRQLWDTGEDILRLQQYLNTHGFPIASTGLGSPSHEISTFGPKTFHALKLFQQAHRITPTGYLGPLTRATLSNNPWLPNNQHTYWGF
jgi:peptidoglycan hydrolase-like protein with peptidoglycan-binding domain